MDQGTVGAVGTRRAEAIRAWDQHLLVAPDADQELQDAGVQFPLTLSTRGGAHPPRVGGSEGNPACFICQLAFEVIRRNEDF